MLRYATGFLKGACIGFLFFENVGRISKSYGASMYPTLWAYGEAVLIERLSKPQDLQVGDVVEALCPTTNYLENPRAPVLCKRIKGMPGDLIKVVYANEPNKEIIIRVPPGHCWIEGDNSKHSIDSRHFGPVPLSLIRGRAFWRVNPFHFGSLQNGELVQRWAKEKEEIVLEQQQLNKEREDIIEEMIRRQREAMAQEVEEEEEGEEKREEEVIAALGAQIINTWKGAAADSSTTPDHESKEVSVT